MTATATDPTVEDIADEGNSIFDSFRDFTFHTIPNSTVGAAKATGRTTWTVTKEAGHQFANAGRSTKRWISRNGHNFMTFLGWCLAAFTVCFVAWINVLFMMWLIAFAPIVAYAVLCLWAVSLVFGAFSVFTH